MGLVRFGASKVLAALAVLALAMQMAAAQTDYSAVTDAADWSDVIPVVLQIAGAIAALFVVIRGAMIAVSMIRGGRG